MRALSEDVFVAGQISPDQIELLKEQGIVSILNNRPDFEAPSQPTSDDLKIQIESTGLNYAFVPMAGGLSPDLIEKTVEAFKTLPRPILAFCASGTRSAALWGFAHVKELGVDGVIGAMHGAGYNLEQIRGPLAQYLASVSE